MQLILVSTEHKGHGPHPRHHRVMLNNWSPAELPWSPVQTHSWMLIDCLSFTSLPLKGSPYDLTETTVLAQCLQVEPNFLALWEDQDCHRPSWDDPIAWPQLRDPQLGRQCHFISPSDFVALPRGHPGMCWTSSTYRSLTGAQLASDALRQHRLGAGGA